MAMPCAFLRAHWVCGIWLLMSIPLAPGQDGNVPTKATDAPSKVLALKTERQRWAALNDARRLSDKAEKYERQGKADEAERMAQQALAIEEQVRGPWHLNVAQRLDQVADLYTIHKKDSAAAPLYERARAIRERALSTHPDVYEQQDGELRVKRNQPVDKVGTGQPPSSPPAAPNQ